LNTPVVALVHARVLAYGWWGSYGNTMFLENTNTTGVYLLGHLSGKSPNLESGSIVEPGDEVARAGDTTSSTRPMAAHLHISYYHYKRNVEEDEILVINNGTRLSLTDIWGGKPRDEWLRDPLNHGVTQKPNIRL